MKRVFRPVIVALVLILALALGANAQQFYTTMDDVIMRSLIVTNTASISGATAVGGELTVAGAFNAVGNSSTNGTFSATGAMSSGGALSTGTFLVTANQGNVTVRDGTPITPTGTFQGITSSGNVSTGQMVIQPAGTLVRLINYGSDTVTLTETTNLVMSGNLALGQYDNATFLSDGTRWIQLSTTNN